MRHYLTTGEDRYGDLMIRPACGADASRPTTNKPSLVSCRRCRRMGIWKDAYKKEKQRENPR